MNPSVLLVARREFVERVRDKSFVISSLTTVLIVVGVALLPSLLGAGDPEQHRVGTVGASPLAEALVGAAPTFDAEVEVERFADEAAARAAVADGEIDVALLGDEALTEDRADPGLEALLQTTWRQLRVNQGLQEAGVAAEDVDALLQPPPLELQTLDPGDAAGDLTGIAFVDLMLLYGQLFGYGFWVAMSVVEEKSTRVVEVLLSTIRPRELLAGKVIGVGLLGLFQLLLVAAVALVVVSVTGAVELPPGTVGQLGQVLLWFLLGYAFYACAFAMAASLVSRQEELQNTMTPLSMTVLISFMVAIFTLNRPDSLVATVASYLPPSAPLVMPLRVAAGEAGLFQVALAVGVTLAAAGFIIPFAGRIYAGAVLRTGAKISLRDALRGAR